MRAAFIEGVVVEFVGNDILILDAVHQTVHTFPLSYLDTVDALSRGKSVRNRDQLTELENLGLVATSSAAGGVSRRAVLVGAGALSAALAMPTAALASSETFFVGNEVFEWAANSGQIDVFSVDDPEPASLLTGGSLWTLTIEGVSALGNVSVALGGPSDGVRTLTFIGLALSPAPGTTLQGRLSNSSGELSNLFQISETSSG